jgi:hypothetical protein
LTLQAAHLTGAQAPVFLLTARRRQSRQYVVSFQRQTRESVEQVENRHSGESRNPVRSNIWTAAFTGVVGLFGEFPEIC